MSDPTRTCPQCGAPTVPGAVFCHRCGARLETGAAGDVGPYPSEPTAPAVWAAFGDERTGRPDELSSPGGGPSTSEDWAGTASEPESSTGAPADETRAGGESGPYSAEPTARAGEWVAGETADASGDDRLARALRGEYEVRIGTWMSRGWTIFTRAGGLFIAFAAIHWLLYWFAVPVWILLAPILMAGFFVAALKVRGGERIQFADFWLSFNDFVPLFLAGIVSTALMLAGLCTCGVGTIYLWVAYQFVYPLILDRRLEFWDAMETSRKAVTKQWFGLFVLALLLFLLNLVAFLVTLSIGLVVTMPFTACVLIEAYADIFGVRGGMPGRSRAPAPPTPVSP